MAVNIGGVHENLVESELFGHEKGAFTGADGLRIGLFELAGEGSLFLDEIGEMPLPLQVKLLRVLQERKIRRLGGTRDIPVAARILSATNRDLEEHVRQGRFREDLYYRLNVVRISVPPLRDRAADIPLLVGHLLEKLGQRMQKPRKTISPEALGALTRYPFPGNIRELENFLERAMIASEEDVIVVADLDLNGALPRLSRVSLPSPPANPGPLRSMSELERDAIANALEKWNGNRTRAALELGISRRTILNKIKKFGLS